MRNERGTRSTRGIHIAIGSALLILSIGCASTTSTRAVRYGTVSPTQASQGSISRDAGGWQASVTPGMWFPAIDGNVEVGRMPEVGVSESIFDSVEDFDAGVSVSAVIGRERAEYAVLAEYLYLRTKDDHSWGATEIRETMIEADLAYRVQGSEGGEIFGGIRSWDADINSNVRGIGRVARERQWFDPVVGIRAFFELEEPWALQFRGDIGGFGIGSDFTNQLSCDIHYKIGYAAKIGFGYRVLDVDYEDGNYEYDIKHSGPTMGLVVGNY